MQTTGKQEFSGLTQMPAAENGSAPENLGALEHGTGTICSEEPRDKRTACLRPITMLPILIGSRLKKIDLEN